MILPLSLLALAAVLFVVAAILDNRATARAFRIHMKRDNEMEER